MFYLIITLIKQLSCSNAFIEFVLVLQHLMEVKGLLSWWCITFILIFNAIPLITAINPNSILQSFLESCHLWALFGYEWSEMLKLCGVRLWESGGSVLIVLALLVRVWLSLILFICCSPSFLTTFHLENVEIKFG